MPGKPPPEKQCTARSRRTGQRCEAWRVKGSAVCYHHGGVTPRGVEAGAFRHGRYSKSLPDQLTSTYRQVLADEQRHDLRDELALSRAKADDTRSPTSGVTSSAHVARLAPSGSVPRPGSSATSSRTETTKPRPTRWRTPCWAWRVSFCRIPQPHGGTPSGRTSCARMPSLTWRSATPSSPPPTKKLSTSPVKACGTSGCMRPDWRTTRSPSGWR